MFGFVVGVLSVAALVGAFRLGARRRLWRAWRGHRRGGWVLDRMLWRLGARPDQEAEIRKVLQQLFDDLRRHRATLDDLRRDLADAVGGDSSEASALDGAFAKAEAAAGSAKETARQAFARLHAILDAGQRARLADLLRGTYGHGRHGCGPQAHPVQL